MRMEIQMPVPALWQAMATLVQIGEMDAPTARQVSVELTQLLNNPQTPPTLFLQHWISVAHLLTLKPYNNLPA